MPRKRTHDEMVSSEAPAASPGNELQHKIRNMWEFAALYEWMHLFGSVVKLQPIDIEDLEAECVRPGPSNTLDEIGLAILKFVSSRRDLTLENWDETVRRQYEYKREGRPHPYGDDEEHVNKFRDFHIFTKIRVLHQLAVWTFHNPDRMRQHFPDYKETDMFYDWQAHPCGWDRHDRVYYSLQGNRLYRRTDPPIPEATKVKPKYTSKKAQAQRRRERVSKRRKVLESDGDDTEMGEGDENFNDTTMEDGTQADQTIATADPEELNTFGDYKWECIATSLDDFETFTASLAKSKDPNERNLRAFVEHEMLPELQKAKERRERKEAERLRELQMQERMLGAKRSGRLAAKHEREKEEAEQAEAERVKQALLAEARKQEERQHRMENERRSRMLTREQRIKEREYKRVLMEEQLARDSEEERRLDEEGGARGSRHLKERIRKNKRRLEEWDGDEWSFDCSGCGQHGKNFDDGEHSIACERCNVWQHSKCLGFSKSAAESDDFHFVCGDCKQREEEANRPKISLKFRVGSSSSPPQQPASSPPQATSESPLRQKVVSVDVPLVQRPSVPGTIVNGQFYPSPAPARPLQPAPAQPVDTAGQASLPGYAQNQWNKMAQQINGTHPVSHPGSTGYAQPYQSHNAQHYTFYNHFVQQQPLQNGPPAASDQQGTQPPPRPLSSHSQTSRPASNHSHINGSSPIRPRIPSPIINRPTMSPTQGNPDVGPIAGVPGSSPSLQHATALTPYANGYHGANGTISQSTPNNPRSVQSSFSGSQPLSGLSPTKQRPSISATPLPQPSLVPQKQRQENSFTTPSSSFNNDGRMRSVSSTPVFPPVENLAPSPQQLKPDPVPTPSKQSPPLPPGGFSNENQPPQSQTQELNQQQRKQSDTAQ